MTDEKRLEYLSNLERRLGIQLSTTSGVTYDGLTISIGVTKRTSTGEKKRFKPKIWKEKNPDGSITVNLPLDKSSILVSKVQNHISKVMAKKSYQRSSAGKKEAVADIASSISKCPRIQKIINPTASGPKLSENMTAWDPFLQKIQRVEGYTHVKCLCQRPAGECTNEVRKNRWFLVSEKCQLEIMNQRTNEMGLLLYDDPVTGESGRRVVLGSDSFNITNGSPTAASRLIPPLRGTTLGAELMEKYNEGNKTATASRRLYLENNAEKYLEVLEYYGSYYQKKKKSTSNMPQENVVCPDVKEFLSEENIRRVYQTLVLPLIEKHRENGAVNILDAGRLADGGVEKLEQFRWLLWDENPLLVMPDGSNIPIDYVGSSPEDLIQVEMNKIPSDSGAKSSGMELGLMDIALDEHPSHVLNRIRATHNTDCFVEQGKRESNNMRYTIVISIVNLKELLDRKLIAINKNAIKNAVLRLKLRFPDALYVDGGKKRVKG